MRRIAATASGTAFTVLALGLTLGAAPALADTPWTPYEQQDALVPAARSTCAFDVQESVVEDAERYRTTATYPDGSPKTQVFQGTLVMSYTNTTTGTTVTHDLSGTGVFEYNADGSPASLTSTHGPFGATMPAGSTPDTGIFVLSGHGASVTFNADGTRSYQVGPSGSVIDVCAELD
ncbi:hypothetical protein [Pedococcus bigeumensis]|uniref:Uncharacterized protein n=1 Tax=Pedococcus bigeumensis TaxID=433644 RepID=A0A502CSR9_9MICO|nr:hypothetical protein [Pedococcus bigeumensis]TPG14846.1 hypothetical protein EAH86_14905 [Pedococcus bigeumensis]